MHNQGRPRTPPNRPRTPQDCPGTRDSQGAPEPAPPRDSREHLRDPPGPQTNSGGKHTPVAIILISVSDTVYTLCRGPKTTQGRRCLDFICDNRRLEGDHRNIVFLLVYNKWSATETSTPTDASDSPRDAPGTPRDPQGPPRRPQGPTKGLEGSPQGP